MAMIVAIPKERRAKETRVAATPETVKKLKGLGLEVAVETGAGAAAHFSDADYLAAGASLAPDAATALKTADIVLKVRGPSDEEIALLKRGAILVALLAPATEKDTIGKLAQAGIDAFAMEFLPRISRAQAMDVLSSQANLAGYKAVVDAAAEFGRAMPMMMTAAGTIAPARVTEDMVKTMKPGSVLVDLAAEQGGNCPLTKPDEVVEAHGVTLMGYCNLPGRLAVDSSSLYARNLFNFVSL